jgi:hypothetical protein
LDAQKYSAYEPDDQSFHEATIFGSPNDFADNEKTSTSPDSASFALYTATTKMILNSTKAARRAGSRRRLRVSGRSSGL